MLKMKQMTMMMSQILSLSSLKEKKDSSIFQDRFRLTINSVQIWFRLPNIISSHLCH